MGLFQPIRTSMKKAQTTKTKAQDSKSLEQPLAAKDVQTLKEFMLILEQGKSVIRCELMNEAFHAGDEGRLVDEMIDDVRMHLDGCMEKLLQPRFAAFMDTPTQALLSDFGKIVKNAFRDLIEWEFVDIKGKGKKARCYT